MFGSFRTEAMELIRPGFFACIIGNNLNTLSLHAVCGSSGTVMVVMSCHE